MKICKDCKHVIEYYFSSDTGGHIARTCKLHKAKTKINPISGEIEKCKNQDHYLIEFKKQKWHSLDDGIIDGYYKYCKYVNKNGKCKDWEAK